jgi:hypothetical protein
MNVENIEEQFNRMKEIADANYELYYQNKQQMEEIKKVLKEIEKRNPQKFTYTIGEINAYLG